MAKLKEFLDELAKLTQKYEMKIEGCGECGSPWIADFGDETLLEHLTYELDRYGPNVSWDWRNKRWIDV